jgi:hypothetical protein
MGYFEQRGLENEDIRHIPGEVAIWAGHLARCPDRGTRFDTPVDVIGERNSTNQTACGVSDRS